MNRSRFTLIDRLSVIRNRCYDRREALIKAAIWLMSFLAATRLAYQFWRLLLDNSPNGAIDLGFVHKWVGSWFAGDHLNEIILLPASYAMLWPFTGWLSFESSRWLWALLYIIFLVWLSFIVIRETGSGRRRDVLFTVLFILAIYPTSITIGNGQLILFLLPCILTAVLMESEHGIGAAKEIIVSFLFLFSLLKTTIAVPFLLIPLVRARAFRPLAIAGCGYILLTYIAISYRDSGAVEIFRTWLHDSTALAAVGGYADVHIWLARLGLKQFILPLSFIILGVFGLWLYTFREADVWIHLGVAAIVARLWTYHRLYDDLLILIPVITVFRIVRSGRLSPNQRLAANLLLAVSWLGLLSPGFFLQLPFPFGTPFRTAQAFIWLSLLAFLLYYSYKTGRTEPA